MIFVTVGNGEFESLVREIDRLKGCGAIQQEVTIQLGRGKYHPKHCQWFDFCSPLDSYYTAADLVICHGGPGTLFELLRLGKKIIALPNRDHIDLQQVEFLQAMHAETKAFIYCAHVQDMQASLEKVKQHTFVPYQPPPCTIGELVHNAMQKGFKTIQTDEHD